MFTSPVLHLQPALRLLTLTLAASLVSSGAASAQERPAPAIELAGGALIFADDGYPAERFVGGAARVYLSPRVSVGPEAAFVSGDAHSHFMLTGNVTVDLRAPHDDARPTFVPFVVAGAGLFQSREEFPAGAFTSADPSFTAGGGIRVRLGQRVFAGAEARVGWEAHIRVNGLIGVSLGE